MKKINILLGLVISLCIGGCTNLDETVYSNIPINSFFKNEKELVANAGRAYSKLQSYTTEQSLWTLLLQASDECAVPACGGQWYSNGRYEEIQTNVIPPANKLVLKAWNWIFNGIAACNEIIYETQLSNIEFSGKDKIVSEMNILRDFYYYEAIANWGTVPFNIDYTDTGYPVPKSRKEIFSYLIQNINDNIANLDKTPSSSNYGRITQGAAYCLLAKLYLNAEVWLGTAMYDQAATACKAVMDLGAYSLEDDYENNFNVGNENSKENIFVIPYDNVYTTGDNAFILFTLTLNAASKATFNILSSPWSGFICEPDFYQSYNEKDIRRSESWLYGEQLDVNGKDIGFAYTPVFDEKYYYNSNGGRGEYDGARCWKWHYQTDSSLKDDYSSMNNDFAIFRYADVVLMYTEALIRQGKVSEVVQNSDLQKIRTRAGLKVYTTDELTLDEIYAERGRELAWEGWRHEDMIRFGKYLKKYWAHPDQSSDTFRTLFPIPTSILNANPNLKQNTGY